MPKTWPVRDQNDRHIGWMIFCPACNTAHHLDFRWSFNGDHERPTFGPSEPGGNCSLLVKTNHPGWRSYDLATCHSHITDGKIAYCADCNHSMAGQTVDLPDKASLFDQDL